MPENIPFEKKELIIVVHNPNNLPVIDFHELKELQGDLKITTPAKIEKLKKSIIKYGIFVPKFIWIEKNSHYIVDGHQTINALSGLEKGGYLVPPIPYVEIHAKNQKDAGEKLLMLNSRFADINPKTSFFEDFDIELDYLDDIEIPEFQIAFDHDERFKKGKGFVAQEVSFIKSEEEALKVHHPELFEGKDNILISFSGGKDSSFALLWAKKNFPDKHIIAFFSNTNVEFPGMAAHVVDCCKFLDVEYKIIYPKHDMWLKIAEKGWPTGVFPWCQTYFIHNPIDKEHSLYEPDNCIILDGSAAKQASRLSTKTKTSGITALKKHQFYHPAFDISREAIDAVLEKSGIPIWEGYTRGFIRSACWMCPYQCGEQAYALNENYPGLVNVIRRWEKKIGKPIRYLDNRSIDDLIETGRKKVDKKKQTGK